MAAPKPYYRRSNYRYLSGDTQSPLTPDSIFELDESDIWNVTTPSPDLRKPVPTHRISNKPSPEAINRMASSLPVNVPDWSKILKEDYGQNRRRYEDSDEFDDGVGDRIPPHEFVARQIATSFSVHEGVGRTLKGRDLHRVRNAIWAKTGFQD